MDVAYYNKGNIFYQQREFNDAINNYKEALNINPNYAEAWYNKGNALMNLSTNNESNYYEAIDAFEKAIVNGCNQSAWCADAWKNKGIAYGKVNNTTGAEDALAHSKWLRNNSKTNS